MPDIEKEVDRRVFNKVALGGLMLLAFPQLSGKSSPSPITKTDPEDENPTKKSKGLGFTFSTFQCQNLGMSEQQTRNTLEELCSIGFDTVRICSYWDRIDKRSYFDFTELDWQLKMTEKYEKEVILTVGIKSPRQPEFFFPEWIVRKYPNVKIMARVHLDSDLKKLTDLKIEKVVQPEFEIEFSGVILDESQLRPTHWAIEPTWIIG